MVEVGFKDYAPIATIFLIIDLAGDGDSIGDSCLPHEGPVVSPGSAQDFVSFLCEVGGCGGSLEGVSGRLSV